jgi:hypothetical protein
LDLLTDVRMKEFGPAAKPRDIRRTLHERQRLGLAARFGSDDAKDALFAIYEQRV